MSDAKDQPPGPPESKQPPTQKYSEVVFGQPDTERPDAPDRPTVVQDGWTRWGLLLAVAAVVALVAGSIGGATAAFLMNRADGAAVSLSPIPSASIDRAPDSIAGIVSRVLPAVVSIEVRAPGRRGTGSGVVIATEGNSGHILTNNHVAAPAADGGQLRVIFHGGQELSAEIVGQDAQSDLAVLKVAGISGLKAAALGNSDTVVVGDPAIAIGAPFGLEGTVTAGIISAKDRTITVGGGEDPFDFSRLNALQTDAAINRGNSGGPLVNARGEVIGINSVIAIGPSSGFDRGPSGNVGIGFAIPINQARRIAEQLIRTGSVEHAFLGVVLDQLYPGEGARIATDSDGNGPVIQPGGPADRAGLRPGDVIMKLAERNVKDADELIATIQSKAPGDQLRVTYRRADQERTTTVTLAGKSS